MKTSRPYYRTKAKWASAQAAYFRNEVDRTRAERIPSAQWRRAQRKMRALDSLGREAARYEQLAARYREQGV